MSYAIPRLHRRVRKTTHCVVTGPLDFLWFAMRSSCRTPSVPSWGSVIIAASTAIRPSEKADALQICVAFFTFEGELGDDR